MVVSLPVYVEAVTRRDERTVHRCRPLFFAEPETRSEYLGAAIAELTREFGRQLRLRGEEPRHDELAARLFSPPLETRQCKFSVDLRQHIVKCRFLFVSIAAFGRHVSFTPSVPDLWFEVAPGENLAAKAEGVVAAHFQRLVKRDGWTYAQLDELSLTGRAWVTTIDIHVAVSQRIREKAENLLAALFGAGPTDGAVELDGCGRCLDWLYPDELDRPLHRDAEVARLVQALQARDRRPIALVGPRMVGKTCIVHGAVRRREQRRRPRAEGERVWLLSPKRLISGMMAVGQWEQRLLAILEEAKGHDHVLYFDDVLGLYRAGASAASDLTVADVLRTHVLRRDVRVLAEMTPEMFRAFAERDRGLADQFEVLPVEPLQAPETLQVLLEVRRRLEIRHRCSFDVDVLPTVIDLQRRYVRDAEFPGKGAAFLNQLALTYPRSPVTRDTVYKQFHEQTGLALTLLDGRRKMRRADVLEALRRRVIGQEPVLEVLADVVSVAKARLNATDRPLATLLFAGPTGVGKTECAKALAAYLFGRDEHLVRLDMNEYDSPAAASRLVGTFLEPEGLLTAPVRRQPFCVVLLDEIEKADPSVFDMLLQVMGEGRLTDAVGRTTDFSSAIVIMTSNLGTREVAKRIGFGDGEEARERAFVAAVEAFFRPEFVNRIDRIVPFRQLSRQQMRVIAELLIAEVIGREGLVRRRCALNVDAQAMELVVDEGYHPQLGARALKRMIERRMIEPVSARLSTLKPEQPVAVDVHAARGGIVVRVSELAEVEPVGRRRAPSVPEEALERVEAALARVEEEIREDRPRGEISPATLTQAHHYCLEMSAIAERLRNDVENARDRYGVGRDAEEYPDSVAAYAVRQPHRGAGVDMRWPDHGPHGVLAELGAASDLRTWLREFHASRASSGGSRPDGELASLRDRTALFVAMHAARHRPDRAVLFVRGPGRAAESYVRRLADLYRRVFAGDPFGADDRMDGGGLAMEGDAVVYSRCSVHDMSGMSIEDRQPLTLLVVEGVSARPIATSEIGTHLMVDRQGSLVPIQVGRLPAGASNDEGHGPPGLSQCVEQALLAWDEATRAWEARRAGNDGRVEGAPHPPLRRCFDDTRRAWLNRVDRSEARLDEDPFPWGPVVRICDERTATVDLRTRMSVAGWPAESDLRRFVAASLPLGDETD